MRKVVGILMVVTLLLAFGPTANATKTWVSGTVGNWSDVANWGGTALTVSETAQVNNGTCNLDSTQAIGQFLMGAASGNVGVLNMTSGYNLTVAKQSGEIFGMLKASGATATVNHSSGTLRVFGTGTSAGVGETRLVTSSTTTGSSVYNLSGTAVLDTEVLSKGNATASGAVFNATGGTLVIRNMIYRFGLISNNGVGFNLGAAAMEVGDIDTVGAISIGNATNATDFTATAGILDIDIAGVGAGNYDKVTQYGTVCNLAGATMQVDLIDGFTATMGDTFDVWAFSDGTKSGTGSVIGLATGWAASWVDSGTDGGLDTLRLTYTPEPATIALLGLGFLAMRRSKK